jgi:hypothetical protein
LRAGKAVAAALLVGLAAAGMASAKGTTTRLVTSTSLTLGQADQSGRLEAFCPKGKLPYGGGMSATPGPGASGEGVYPHSFERLGVQHGFHVSSVLFDSAAPTTARTVLVQAVCGPDPGKVSSPKTPLQVGIGQTQSATATCPARQHLIAGGFQQTTFTSKGGSFAAQSQAVGNNAWTVTASAFGNSGGPAYAAAYCVRGKSSWQEVSASTPIAPGATGTATTPPCPAGRRLVSDGFNTSPAGAVLFGNGVINPDQSFSASGYDRSTAGATITGYAYCLRITAHKPRKKK